MWIFTKISTGAIPVAKQSASRYAARRGGQARLGRRQLAPGAMVPSIVTIHQEYGIAKTTARKVLAALRDEGLIITTPGWGSFVAGKDTRQS